MWKKYTKFATKCPLSEISELRATFVAPIKNGFLMILQMQRTKRYHLSVIHEFFFNSTSSTLYSCP